MSEPLATQLVQAQAAVLRARSQISAEDFQLLMEALSDARDADEAGPSDFEAALAVIEAMAQRLEAAAKVFRDARLILGGGHGAQRDAATPRSLGHETAAPISAEPFPCAECGRVRPERPGETVQVKTCDSCGNRLPGGTVPSRVMNKGEERRNGVVTAMVQPLTPEERAAKLSMPAFGADGLPVEEEA